MVFNKLQGTGLIILMGVESLGSSHASGDTMLVEGEASSYWVRVEGPTGHVVATYISGLHHQSCPVHGLLCRHQG